MKKKNPNRKRKAIAGASLVDFLLMKTFAHVIAAEGNRRKTSAAEITIDIPHEEVQEIKLIGNSETPIQ